MLCANAWLLSGYLFRTYEAAGGFDAYVNSAAEKGLHISFFRSLESDSLSIQTTGRFHRTRFHLTYRISICHLVIFHIVCCNACHFMLK